MDTINAQFSKNEFEDELLNNSIIDIWVEVNGRKKNTYIHGWELELSELKDHLRTIKKKKGCNGSLKEIVKEIGKIKVLQFQGNQKDFIFEYLKSNGIDSSFITIKI